MDTWPWSYFHKGPSMISPYLAARNSSLQTSYFYDKSVRTGKFGPGLEHRTQNITGQICVFDLEHNPILS